MDLDAQRPLVLVAEADAMVAEDVSDALRDAGYRVLGPFATTGDALAAMEQESPALAVVDVKLRDGFCTALGRELRHRDVPLLVHSGLQRDEPRALGFQDVPWISKPALPRDIVALLDELSSALAPAAAPAIARLQPPETEPNPLVRKLEGFVTLSETDRALLERMSAHAVLIGPRTDLIREGDTPDGVFLIMKGIACRHKARENGARQIMAYLLPGDLCDLHVALLSTMDHSISTLSACNVIRIAPETVAELMHHHPQIARGLRVSTLVDEATLREWLLNVGRRSPVERIAHLFCELLVRLEIVGHAREGSYALPLTAVELADTTGLSGVDITRGLQELRRRGLIDLQDGRLTIHDLPRLKDLAEFRSNYLHLKQRAAA